MKAIGCSALTVSIQRENTLLAEYWASGRDLTVNGSRPKKNMESALTNLLAVAADALAQGHQNPQATALLRYLGYDDVDPRITPNRIKLLQAGASFRRLFQLPMPDAPGLVFIGAEGDPASLYYMAAACRLAVSPDQD